MIPIFDMKARHVSLREEYLQAIGEVIDTGAFSGGPFVECFENDFSTYCGTQDAVGVGSGTEALWLTLLAMGIGPGDEVITVPMSFVATVEAICFAGAKPVFVDIDEQTYTLNPEALEDALTIRTKAIIPVHLFGQPADMDPIIEFARKHGLRVIEDASQAHGAEYNSQMAGSIADAGCFSFYPGKNLGALGEGGAIVSEDKDLTAKIRLLRDHGRSAKNRHSVVGWNGRMDGIQAAVLSIKLQRLDGENQLRRNHALAYDQALENLVEIHSPTEVYGGKHVFHIYALRVRERHDLIWALESKQIQCGIHYPVPIHLQAAYRSLGYRRGDFPVSEQCADEFVSLPMFPEMTPEQIGHVTDAISEAAEWIL